MLKMHRPNKYVVAALLIIAVIVLGAVLTKPVRNQLNDWKLLPRPEKITELYFTTPNNLRKSYKPGKAQTLSFTVHNLEYQTYRYNYEIVEQGENGGVSHILQTGSFVLNHNQFAKRVLQITPLDLGGRVEVSVRLTNINESIDLWLHRL